MGETPASVSEQKDRTGDVDTVSTDAAKKENAPKMPSGIAQRESLEREVVSKAAEAGVSIGTDTDLEVNGNDEETTPSDQADGKKSETLLWSFLAALVSAKDGILDFLEKMGLGLRTRLEKFFGAEEGTDPTPDQDMDSDDELDTDTAPVHKERQEQATLKPRYLAEIRKLLLEFGITESEDYRKDFVHVALRLAEEVEAQYGVPRSVVVAQACLESRFGESGLSQGAFNCFGFKTGNNYQGGKVTLPTWEYINGQKTRTMSDFRSYSSIRDSFMDYGRLISTRYKKAYQYVNEPRQFLSTVIEGGYATDPNDYVGKAEKILAPYDLRLT